MGNEIIINSQLKANIDHLNQECEAALLGKFSLPINEFCIALTNRCNLHCIMCPYCSPEYENKTYHNEKPFTISIEQYRKLFTREWVDKQRFSGDGDVDKDEFIINFTHGESLLNPAIVDILAHTREVLPNAKIKLLSNGTISPNSIRKGEDLLRYVDILGFSMDGCTKETFEAIRTPAKFDNVIENLRKWASLGEKYAPRKMFRFNVALSQMNICELPGLLRLADSLGGFDFIYVQPLLVGEKRSHLNSIKLEYMDKVKGRAYLEDALEISEETGIRLIIVNTITQMFGLSQARDVTYHDVDDRLTRFCTYLRSGLMELNPDGSMREICCNMLGGQNAELMSYYRISQKETPFEIYNSEGYWQLRKDLLEGKLLDACKGCSYGNKDYYDLSANPYKSKVETIESLKNKVFLLRKSKALLKDEYIALQKANAEVARNNKVLQKQNKELLETNLILRNTNNEVAKNNKSLQSNNKELSEITSTLRRTNVEVAQNNEMLQRQNKELRESIEILRENNDSLLKENADAEYQCLQMKKTILGMQEKIASLELNMRMIYSSFSWKITKPLRLVKKLISKYK